jgi:hypothetical protein
MKRLLAKLTWPNLRRALIHPPNDSRSAWDWVRVAFLGVVVVLVLVIFFGTFDAFSTIARNFYVKY